MTLTSLPFLLIFVPLGLGVYWIGLRGQTARSLLLLILSLLFYLIAAPQFVLLLVIMSLATFALAQRRRILPAILLNLLPLVFFKAITASAISGQSAFLILPLGISYYTFKHIGYLMDVRQRRYEPTRDWLSFLSYSAFFPQIVAGPISSFGDTGKQLQALPAGISSAQVYEALVFITLGLAKKLLIGDTLARAISNSGDPAGQGAVWAWLTVGMFALQVYFDFSGYTDMVLGIAGLFGVKLPQNFNNPFLADSARAFWDRWHMSLSSWFRVYVFFPLTRFMLNRYPTRSKELIQYGATVLTMVFIGIWHGFTWGFLLWGLYNGVLLALQSWGERRAVQIEPYWAHRTLFIIATVLGFGLFAYPTITPTRALFAAVFGMNGWGEIGYDATTLLTLSLAIGLTVSGRVEAANIPRRTTAGYAFVVGVLAVLCLIQLGGEVVNFAYARF